MLKNTQKLIVIWSSLVIPFLLLQKRKISKNQYPYCVQIILDTQKPFKFGLVHKKQKNQDKLLLIIINHPLFHLFYNQNSNIMNQAQSNSPALNVTNYKRVVRQLIQPHKEKIHNAAQHFKAKIAQYRSASLPRRSQQQEVRLVAARRSPSLFSEMSAELEPQQIKEDKIVSIENITKNNQLQQWQSTVKPAFTNYNNLAKYYQQIYYAKKCFRKNNKDYYDFKIDEKEMLTKIFHQIKTQQNAIQFQAILQFFDKCRLFYLCYNIKPNHLLDLLKDSAHQYSNKLTLLQFLNVFFIDRPNLTNLYDNQSIKIAKQCILNEQSWKQLKQIFNTLDTFGNQTIAMAPFLFKIKNNHANWQLINQPTIQYPEINRTLPMKKIIFNLENRYKFEQKITWPQIEKIIKNFKYQSEPTIDVIYKRLIQRGKITKFSNYFMINNELIQEIKHIFNRCPKYCQYFIKTKFLCNQLLESTKIKTVMKQTIVRIIRNGNKDYPTTLQQQIRLISKNAEDYIDLDQLLEYFTIKGPINTKADVQVDLDESDSEQQEQRMQKLRHIKSADKLISLKKSGKYPKPVRHLTICQEFKLSTKQGETTMQRRTRQWKQQKQKQVEMQLKRKFKANPIPAQLNPQRYKQYQKQLEESKAIKREQFLKKKQEQNQVYQYLKTNTNLFTVKQRVKTQPKEHYKFTPKSIPWHIVETNMLQTINNQKALRKKKILNENKVKILREWKKLPDVMQNYEELTQQNNSSDNEASQANENESYKDEKNVRQKSKVKEVPDFKKLHIQFEQQLNKKKLKFTPTVPIAPAFTQLKKRQQKLQTKQVSRVRSAGHLKYIQSSAQHKTSVQTCIAKQHIQIPTTKKYESMVELTQQRLQSKQIQKIRQEEAQRERQSKQYNFAKFMQKRLKQTLRKSISLAQLCKNQIKNRKKEQKRQLKKAQQEMYQMYSRVMARPFLFENTDSKQYSSLPKVTKSSLLTGYSKKVNGVIQQQKHVHQSPLKYIDPEQQSPNKEAQKHQLEYEMQSQSEQSRNKAYLMNQSF